MASATNLLPPFKYFQDLNRNLGVYYLVAHIVSILIVVVLGSELVKKHRLIIPLVLLSLYYIKTLLPFYLSADTTTHEECQKADACVTFKALQISLPLYGSGALPVQLVAKEKPDLLGLIGYNKFWKEHVKIGAEYPNKIELPTEDGFGLALYSKFPFTGEPLTKTGADTPPVVKTGMVVGKDRVIEVTLFKAEIPSAATQNLNKLIVRRLLTIFKHDDIEGIVMTELNATPFAGAYGLLTSGAMYDSTMEGRGLAATWTGGNGMLRLSFDHILYRGFLAVKDMRVLESVGSTHQPISAEFEIPKQIAKPWKIELHDPPSAFLPF